METRVCSSCYHNSLTVKANLRVSISRFSHTGQFTHKRISADLVYFSVGVAWSEILPERVSERVSIDKQGPVSRKSR